MGVEGGDWRSTAPGTPRPLGPGCQSGFKRLTIAEINTDLKRNVMTRKKNSN
jgi:hypothetical protein